MREGVACLRQSLDVTAIGFDRFDPPQRGPNWFCCAPTECDPPVVRESHVGRGARVLCQADDRAVKAPPTGKPGRDREGYRNYRHEADCALKTHHRCFPSCGSVLMLGGSLS